MKTAAGNQAGAMTGFMGMGMAMNQGGGMNAQNLFAMGQQQQAQQDGRRSRLHNRPFSSRHRRQTDGSAAAETLLPASSVRNAEARNRNHSRHRGHGNVNAEPQQPVSSVRNADHQNR